MFDSWYLALFGMSWFKAKRKTQQLVSIGKRNPFLMMAVFTFGQTRRMSGEWWRPSMSNFNMHGAIFRPSCFDLRDPEDSQRAGWVSNTHYQLTPLKAKHRGLCIAFKVKRTVDKPRFGQHRLSGLGRHYCICVSHSMSCIFSAR